jgi:hypothetical protein
MAVPGATRGMVRHALRQAGVAYQPVGTHDAVTIWEETRRRDAVLARLELNGAMTMYDLAAAVGCGFHGVRAAVFTLMHDGCVRRTDERRGRSPIFEAAP